ncbi:MAG TPA: MmgE/PrpD family protein [Frankiaceae bacterium]
MSHERTVVQQIADLAARVAADGLDDALRHDVARRYLDLLGNSLAATELSPGLAVTAMVDEWGGRPQSTVIGSRTRLPAASAALVNGTLAHSLDFDDTHLPSVLHPSSSVLPAALAVAEARGADGASLLDAAGVGVEVTSRLGMAGYDQAARSNVFFDRGQHATSICGAIGASVAAAMLHGLDADGIAHAAGIAASMGAGVIEANRTGGTVKRIHCGWAAHAGVAAADLARFGITGPPTVIEGRFGFLQAWLGEHANVSAVTEGLGERWELPGIFFKPYPCNHFTHAGIDAALRMRAAGVRAEEVEEIELGVPTSVLRTIAEPAEAKARPESGYHAAFSGPYTVASALLGGGGLGLSHDDFADERARDPERLALAARVRCVPDARCDEIFPEQLPAVLRVRLRDGRQLEERVDVNRGGPQNPLTDDEIRTKYRINASRALDPARVEELAEAALALPGSPDLGRLMAPLSAAVR